MPVARQLPLDERLGTRMVPDLPQVRFVMLLNPSSLDRKMGEITQLNSR